MTTTTTDQPSTSVLDQLRNQSLDGRIRISVAGAGLLALTSAALAAIYVRNQTHRRAREVAWLALRSGAGASLSGPRRVLPLGGSLLLLSTLAARRQWLAQQHVRSTPDRPGTRDVLLGVALGLGLVNILGRGGRA